MSRSRVATLGALAAAFLLAGCSLEVSYTDTHYACDPAIGTCPTGFECSTAGWCEARRSPVVDAGEVADVAPLDDGALPPDADVPPPPDSSVPLPPDANVPPPPPDANVPPPPDAALPPDASPPPVTANFTATRDTQLYSPSPTFNYGDFNEIQCDHETNLDSPLLYGWNLSSIPTTATVQSAVLHITTSTMAFSGGSMSVYKLLEDWTEGTLDGAPGVANYNQRKTSTNWAGAGASGASRAASASASFTPATTQTTFDVNLPASLVQSWVSSPSTNYGVVLTCPTGKIATFYTRASTPSSRQPRLTITYVP